MLMPFFLDCRIAFSECSVNEEEEKTMRNAKGLKRITALMLALIMVMGVPLAGILPLQGSLGGNDVLGSEVYAGETGSRSGGGSVTADVSIVSQAYGGFLHDVLSVSVDSGLAESYGYTDSVPKETAVSALDVLVKAHQLAFEEAYSADAEDKDDYLQVDYGWVTNAFGLGNAFSFTVNGVQPSNGIYNESYGSYTGYAVNQAAVHDGDNVEFFILQDTTGWSDKYTWFEYDGSPADTLHVKTGDETELILKGYSAAWYGASTIGGINANTSATANATIYAVDVNDTAAGKITVGATNSSGSVSLKFDTAGEYRLYIPDEQSGAYYLQPNLKLVVSDGLTDEAKALNAAEQLGWDDIRGENDSIYNVSKKLNLIKTITGASITWTSSNATIINVSGTKAGTVTPDAYEDSTVILTAKVKAGSKTVNKYFTLNVYQDTENEKPVKINTDEEKAASAAAITAVLTNNETVTGLSEDLLKNRDFVTAYLVNGGTLTAAQKDSVLRMVQADASADMTSNILGSLCKDVLVLSAMGIDPRTVTVDGKEIDIIEKIQSAETSNVTIYNAAYVMLAYSAHESFKPDSDANITEDWLIKYILDSQEKSGEDIGKWGGSFGTPGDTASVALGFAEYLDYSSASIANSDIKNAIELANKYIANNIPTSGDFSSPNYNAYIIMANTMLGNDPKLVRKGDTGYPDVVDGLLKYCLGTDKGFKYSGSSFNLMATADAMRALVSYNYYIDNDENTNPNIYDFSDRTLGRTEWPVGKILTDLFVSPPTKTEYAVGGTLDISGMKATAKYSDGSTADVTAECTLSKFYSSSAGAKTITVTYSETAYDISVSKQAKFIVNVVSESSQTPIYKVSTTVKNAKGKVLASGETVISKNSTTVMDVLKQVLAQAGLSATIENGTYVSSIDGLSEFDMGGNSGWMVRVDGVLINVSAAKYKLQGGETIEWFYTKDYTKVPGAVVPAEETVTDSAVSEGAVEFDDIGGHWGESYIKTLVSKGILNGMGGNIFAPNGKVTRGQFVQIIAKAAGIELESYSDKASAFADVSDKAWYKEAAVWAYENGIIKGRVNSDGGISFDADEEITRQDMAVMLLRYVENFLGEKLIDSEAAESFKDENKIAEYAREAVEKMQKAGIINGRSDGSFAPNDDATRAEAAKMVCILLELLTEQK